MADIEQLVEELSNLTILEASQLKEALEEKWGVTAATGGGGMMMMAGAMPAAGGADGAAAEPEEEKTEFDVVLTEVGPKKINVIKTVRALTSLGLKEAKEVVEGAPSTLMEAISKEAAQDAITKLEADGAKAEMK